MHTYVAELLTAKELAHQAGDIMRIHFNSELAIVRKGDDSPVTKADIEINHMVIETIQEKFGDTVVGEEESTGEYGMGRRWICDPIDGTRAFTWGLPTAMFSLGLAIDGVSTLGVAYDPFLDQLYESVTGSGSFCNGKPIHVSSATLAGSTVAVSGSPEKILTNPAQAKLVQNLTSKAARLACFSGSVYRACLVARGKLSGYVEQDINTHDLAAVDIIIREAGGMITDFDGKPLDYSKRFKGAVISNGVSHKDLLECAAHYAIKN